MKQVCYQREWLDVGDGHHIYYELSGNPDGIPVLFIHGGPGAGLSPNYTEFFDLDAYHVIGFDQRGCGRSTPFLTTQNNTTQHLLSDINTLRESLNIQQWLLFGGSWGTTLALLAAIEAPLTVSGMILRGIFLARQEDFAWFLAPNGGAAQIYPDAYQLLIQDIENADSMEAIMAHFNAVFHGTDIQRKQLAAQRWYRWEEAIAKVYPVTATGAEFPVNRSVLSLSLLEHHYISNLCFIEEGFILEQAETFAHIPAQIIHGRCDTVCKPDGAFVLHQRWPASQLTFVDGAGHSSSEPAISQALKAATQTFKDKL